MLYEDAEQREPVSGSIPNAEAWQPGRILQVGETKFSLLYNPPIAEKVRFPAARESVLFYL